MFIFTNNGKEIVNTNYWESDQAKDGFCFLSWNAGAARLLLPDSLEPAIKEMKSAKYVIISRGKWRDQGNRDALELLFEDNSDSPYCIHIVEEQTDRLIPESEQGAGFIVTVWTKNGKQLELPGRYRAVKELPFLQPWENH